MILKRMLRRMPFVVMRRRTYMRMNLSVSRYRRMRGHVTMDGKIKTPMGRTAAELAAEDLSRRGSYEYEAYGCSFCNGMYHVGRKR